MPFLVVDRKCINTIFTKDDPEIDLLEFKTKEEAEYYLEYGTYKVFDNREIINVFTDGSCSMNGTSNAKAGIGIYFGKNDIRNVSQRIKGKQTNNTAELSAVIEVFSILKDEIKQGKLIQIYTDSEYVIRCGGDYGEKCEIIQWKKKKGTIPNVELVKELYSLLKQNRNVTLKHIKAHTNKKDEYSKGNEEADKLANQSIHKDHTVDTILTSLNTPYEPKIPPPPLPRPIPKSLPKHGETLDRHPFSFPLSEKDKIRISEHLEF
tara:strand:- start:3064 stop:3855 length:792 start_codon:yes stop_codon:yes gene_type:complete